MVDSGQAKPAGPKAAGAKVKRSVATKKVEAAKVATKKVEAAKVARKTPTAAKGAAKKAGPRGQLTTKKAAKKFVATPASVLPMYQALRAAHPDAHCELDHRSAFELVVATVLSAQTTDVAVNKLTPALFRQFPSPNKLAVAEPELVEGLLNKIGMFRQKTKNIIGLAQRLVELHGGRVPETLNELVALPGVGRKTANVVLGVAFGKPEGVVVDTHVQRISQRLGWTDETTPEKIEQALMKLLPQSEWDMLSHTLIFHGRRICTARGPSCSTCPVNQLCQSAFHAESVGRKPARAR